jgi:hypothetical protein
MAAKIFAVVMTAVLALGASSVRAHHSVAGVFDSSKHVTLTGTISQIEWINPHTNFHLDVKDEHGQVTTWRLESLPTAMLRKAGLTSEMLMGGGGMVTADAILARDGTQHLAYLLKLTYEDGHFYQLAGE